MAGENGSGKNTGNQVHWKQLLHSRAESAGQRLGNASLTAMPKAFSDIFVELARGIERGIADETRTQAEVTRKDIDVQLLDFRGKVSADLQNAKRDLNSTLEAELRTGREAHATATAKLRDESSKALASAREANTSATAANLNAVSAAQSAKGAAESVATFTKDISSLEEVDDASGKKVAGPKVLSILADRFRKLQARLSAIDTIYEALKPLVDLVNNGIVVKDTEGNDVKMTVVEAINYSLRVSLHSAQDAEAAKTTAVAVRDGMVDDMHKARNSLVDAHSTLQRLSVVPPGPASAAEAAKAADAVGALVSGLPPSKPVAATTKEPAACPAPVASSGEPAEKRPVTHTLIPATSLSTPPAAGIPRASPLPNICPVADPSIRRSEDPSKKMASLAPPSSPAPAVVDVAGTAASATEEKKTPKLADRLDTAFKAADTMIAEVLSKKREQIDLDVFQPTLEALEQNLAKPSFVQDGVEDEALLEEKAVESFNKLDAQLHTLFIVLGTDDTVVEEKLKVSSYDHALPDRMGRLDKAFENFTKKGELIWGRTSFATEPPSMTSMRALNGSGVSKGGVA